MKLNALKLIAFIFSSLVSLTAFGQNCASCNELDKSTQVFRKLDSRSTVDQETGAKLIDPMLVTIRKASAEASKNAKAKSRILNRLFAMVAASGPFDFESQGAQVLHDEIRKDAAASAQFDKEYSSTKLSCEQKLLKSSILEFRCNDRKSGGKVSSEGGVAECIQTFNYDTCAEPKK